jgi:PAS domain S-box-containing protein
VDLNYTPEEEAFRAEVRAFVRSKTTNWTTVVGVPQAAANAALKRTFNILFGGGALLLLLSLAAALLVGRRIARPIATLARSARWIQGGEHINLAQTDVAEVKQLQDALVAAGAAARTAGAEHERRITAEVKQAAAEAAQSEILDREAKLQESEERLRAFLENSATVAWMSDEEGRYVYLSRNYRQRFNLDQQAWQGKTAFELWPAVTAEKFRRRDLAVLGHSGLEEVIEEAKNADGSRSWWFNSRFVLTDRSGKRYVGGLGVDITERKRLENELERRIDELKEADRRKDEFLVTLSHELRNPLAPIGNAVQVLKAIAPSDAKLEWCRNLIEQQVGYMARLMEDLLDVSRITRDKLDLRKQPVALSEIINNAVETSRPAIEDRRSPTHG